MAFKNLVRDLEDRSMSKVLRFNYETVETPKSTDIPISTFTPEHAVQAAQQGLKIVHKHERVSIDIHKIKSVSPEAESYINEKLINNRVSSIKSDGLPRPLRVKYDPRAEPLSDSLTINGGQWAHPSRTMGGNRSR